MSLDQSLFWFILICLFFVLFVTYFNFVRHFASFEMPLLLSCQLLRSEGASCVPYLLLVWQHQSGENWLGQWWLNTMQDNVGGA